jgi:hypothetical protein
LERKKEGIVSRFARLRRKPVDRIDVLSNPNAGLGKNRTIAASTLAKLDEVFLSSGSEVEVRHRATRDLEHLDQVIDEMVPSPPRMIIVIGGDGTAQKTLDRIIKKFVAAGISVPMIMILGAGTVNAVRGALELLGSDPEKGRNKVFEKIRRGRPLDIIHRDVLKISGEHGLLEHGFIVGLGLPVRFLERYYQHEPPRGFWRALWTVLWSCCNEVARFLPPWRRRSLAHRFPVQYELWSDQARIAEGDDRFAGIVMSSVEQIGLGCKLTHRALEEPDHFHAVFSRMGTVRTVFNALNMFLGAPIWGSVVSEVVTKVVLRFKEPTAIMIDGEMYPAENVGTVLTIERGPTLEFVRS